MGRPAAAALPVVLILPGQPAPGVGRLGHGDIRDNHDHGRAMATLGVGETTVNGQVTVSITRS